MDDDLRLTSGDLLLALKLVALGDASVSIRHLARELGLSKSAIAKSFHRLYALDLVKPGRKRGRRLNKLMLRDFLEHAVRWVAPARVGDFELGLPTAHAAPALQRNLLRDDDPVVMPLPHGPMRGRAVSPVHPLAPSAAARDQKLYDVLAIVDALRIGRARDREVAAAQLAAWL